MNDYHANIAIHPSETLKEHMELIGLSLEGAAAILRVHEHCLQEFLNGKLPVTEDFADRLECLISTKQFWLNLQKNYDANIKRLSAGKTCTIEELKDNVKEFKLGCPGCGTMALGHDDFTDALSRKEFRQSNLCQKCQDDVFMNEA